MTQFTHQINHDASDESVTKITERLIRLTNCISRVQAAFIAEQKDSHLMAASLDDLLAISESDFGFIGEVWQCPVSNQPVLRFLALSNIAWSEPTRLLYEKQLAQQLEFRNLDTLFGHSLRTGEIVISNDPASHPASRGLPHGHPPLKSYMGVPIYYQHELVAMVAVANKKTDYTQADIDFLLPLLNTIGQLIYVGKVRQEELKTKKQLLNVLAAANAATWSLNTLTEELKVNARWAEMLGYRLEDIEPVTLGWMRKNMHPEDLLASRFAMHQHFAGNTDYYDCVFRIRHKSGAWVWVHGRGQVVSGDEATGRMMYGINMDVSEQRNLQQQFERVAALVPGVVLTLVLQADDSVCIPYISEGISHLVPFSTHEITSSPKQLFSLIEPRDRKELVNLIKTDQQLTPRWRHRFRLRKIFKHEEVRWFELQAQAEQDPDKQCIWYCYMDDVTDLVKAELEMQLAREEAEKAANVKSAFIANMSHEIRTPMNGVIGMLDVLAEANNDAKLNDNIAIMRDSAYSLLTIIDDVLDFSKLEAGKLAISLQPQALNTLLEQAFDLLDMMALRQNVELVLFIDPSLDAEFMLDSNRLRQIIVNLVSNAIKFSVGTGRDAKVAVECRLIDQQENQCLVSLSVKDNGIGIAPHTLNRLFKPFVQADDSTSRKYGGTGLGLSITQQLVKLLGGMVTAQSIPDEGSCFTVTLPITQVTSRRHQTTLNGVKVVLLEGDNAPHLDYFECYLRSAGASVRRTTRMSMPEDNEVWLVDVVVLESLDVYQQDVTLPKPMVLLGRGKRRNLRLHSPGVIGIDANCLKLSLLIQAVKQAAEHHWPEQHATASPRVTGTSALPVDSIISKLGKTILVAEDNTTNQKVIKSLLSRLGYDVVIADNGLSALEIAMKSPPDLVLTDLHMPVMDGYGLVKSWQTKVVEGQLPDIPVIALTANVAQGERDRSMAAGFHEYLVKPLPMAQLKQMLETFLPCNNLPENVESKPLEQDGLWVNISLLAEQVSQQDLQEILADYAECLAKDFIALEQAFGQQQPQTVVMLAHKLKSSSRYVGAGELADRLAELEQQAKVPGFDLHAISEKVKDAVNHTLNDLQQFLT